MFFDFWKTITIGLSCADWNRSAYKEPLLYNLAVTRELLKQVYIKESLQPPSLAAFRDAYTGIWSQISKPGFIGSFIRSGDLGRVGVYALQAYGIFKVRFVLSLVLPSQLTVTNVDWRNPWSS